MSHTDDDGDEHFLMSHTYDDDDDDDDDEHFLMSYTYDGDDDD